jgi:C-terminal processing protease CtpA/Prc
MANDIVTHVDAEPLQGLGLNQVLEKMRGPAGSTARLRIVRKGQDGPIEVSIVRAPIGGGAGRSSSRSQGRQAHGRGERQIADPQF